MKQVSAQSSERLEVNKSSDVFIRLIHRTRISREHQNQPKKAVQKLFLELKTRTIQNQITY